MKYSGFFISILSFHLLSGTYLKAAEVIKIDNIGNVKPTEVHTQIDKNTVHVSLTFDLPEDVAQDDWQVNITPTFKPTFNWAPHITPTDNHVIDQHVFRTPAMIVADDREVLVVIPDVEILKRSSSVRWYMDMNAEKNMLTFGMNNNKVTSHVLFERASGTVFPKGKIEYGFYIMRLTDPQDIKNPFRKILSFFWDKWGHDLFVAGNPLPGNLDPYVKHTYNWAFNTWKDAVWQEFELNGKRVGAPVNLVYMTESPNYKEPYGEALRSLWNQAWFSSLRSASGLYRYARRTGDAELMKKANMAKELALLSPQKNGFFYSVIATEMEDVTINGKIYKKNKGWDTYYWGNGNRNPYTGDVRQSPFHILDMSWTSLLMLRWYEELDKDPRLIQYAQAFADALIKIQYPNGFFPGYLDLETMQIMDQLNDSPETSMSVTFLLNMYRNTKNEDYKKAALKGMEAVIKEIIPTGRWEDFETYWSCCKYGSEDLVGKKVVRNNMYKQCNFSMFWTTEALFECFKETGDKKYLEWGQRTLDELLMTQASWQPPYIYVKALGGFGVLNADGEWNDSRESLFAEIILQYGKLLGMNEYKERGLAALRSSFVMMYCPENPITKAQYEKVYPYFGKEDYGFNMENYGHGGQTGPEGIGIGPATHYDWGNGSASEAYNRILDKFGENYVNN